MTPEMEDRYQALAEFMEWVDPDGFADAALAALGGQEQP